jgi:hypothetical protein
VLADEEIAVSKTRPAKKLCLRLETVQLLDVVGGGALLSALLAAAKKVNEKTIVCPSAGGNCQSALANCASVGGGC